MKKIRQPKCILIISLILFSCTNQNDYQKYYNDQNRFLERSITENYVNIELSMQSFDSHNYSKSILELEQYFNTLKNIDEIITTENKELLIDGIDSIKSFISTHNHFHQEASYIDLTLTNISEFVREKFTTTNISHEKELIYENQLLMLEKQITESYFKISYGYTPVLDWFKVEIVPERSQITLRDSFSAKILFAGYPTRYKPRIIVSEIENERKISTDTIEYRINGTSFKIQPSSKGLKELNVTYDMLFKDLIIRRFSSNVKYEVK
jgi:hypothetical protein